MHIITRTTLIDLFSLPALVSRIFLPPHSNLLTELSDTCIHCHWLDISNGMFNRHLKFTLSEQHSWFSFLNVNSSHFFPISENGTTIYPIMSIKKTPESHFQVLFLWPRIISMRWQNIPYFSCLPCCCPSPRQCYVLCWLQL